MKKIILFLDIDGVIVVPNSSFDEELAAEAVDVINELAKTYEVNIIITSMWRVNRSVQQIHARLHRDFGARFDERVIFSDTTPVFQDGSRADEIQDTLDGEGTRHFDMDEIDAHVVIDDTFVDIENFVYIEDFRRGLSLVHLPKIIEVVESQL